MAKKSADSTPAVVTDSAGRKAIAEIEKKYGKGTIMNLTGGAVIPCEAIKTGDPGIDLALGVGGVPRGRVIEIFGPESSGKTTLCLHIIANAQKAGGVAAFIDAEHALDPSWAQRIGVNVPELLFSQPDNAEQALDIVEILVRGGDLDVIVIDSVAALVPRAEIEGEMGDSHIGLQARLMSQALRKLTGIVHKSRTTVIFINQIREKIGVMFGNPETTPGGRALKFYASTRIDIRKIGNVKEGEVQVGNSVRVKIIKNKVAPPFKQHECTIFFGNPVAGFDGASSLLKMASDNNVIEKSGSWYNFGQTRIGNGVLAAAGFLRGNPEISDEITRALWAKLGLTVRGPEKADVGFDDDPSPPPVGLTKEEILKLPPPGKVLDEGDVTEDDVDALIVGDVG